MKVEKRVHGMYEEFEKITNPIIKEALECPYGKYQYVFETDKGMISEIEILDIFFHKDSKWEIYCLEGNLFEGTRRFQTKQEADDVIREMLE